MYGVYSIYTLYDNQGPNDDECFLDDYLHNEKVGNHHFFSIQVFFLTLKSLSSMKDIFKTVQEVKGCNLHPKKRVNEGKFREKNSESYYFCNHRSNFIRQNSKSFIEQFASFRMYMY
jgi:hypothetical protein